MTHLERLLETEKSDDEALPLPARLVDLGLDAYVAGYQVAAEHLFYLAEQMMMEPERLQSH